MVATARTRFIFKIAITCLLTIRGDAAPDKLFPNQKPPPHARSSAGRALALPASGQTPANVGRLKPGGGPPPASTSNIGNGGSPPQEDGVQREESVSFKEVNGETIRVVVGNYAYQSPEGLPVSFKYMADENGNQASFSIGTATAGGSGSKLSGSGVQKPGTGSGPGGSGLGSAGGPTKGGAADGDRKYLPPTSF